MKDDTKIRVCLAVVVAIVVIGVVALVWQTAAIVIACVAGAAFFGYAVFACRRRADDKSKGQAERAVLVQEQVVAAQECVQEFKAHYCVLPGDEFCALESLRSHEQLRHRLLVYDSIADVEAAMDRGEVFVFLSHQWLGYDEPDPDRVHIAAMREAIRSVGADADAPLDRVRVWLDVISIPQRNRSEQKLAIASLPTFASSCNYFVAVAPDTSHSNSRDPCDATSYRRRAWCRAEIMSCWARNGTRDMYLSTSEGLKPLAPSDEILVEALDVFGGDLTCCRRGHGNGEPCDREEIMLPILGLYAEVYRDRKGVAEEAWGLIEPHRERLFPKTFDYEYSDQDMERVSETSPLFGDLVQAIELAVDLDEDPEAARERLQKASDFAPGTSSHRGLQRKAAHFQRAGRRSSSPARSATSQPTSLRALRLPRPPPDAGDGTGAYSPHSSVSSPHPTSSRARARPRPEPPRSEPRSPADGSNSQRRLSRASSMRHVARVGSDSRV